MQTGLEAWDAYLLVGAVAVLLATVVGWREGRRVQTVIVRHAVVWACGRQTRKACETR